ncbi:MAG: Rid family hydrolase [Anaerolineae bacterium]
MLALAEYQAYPGFSAREKAAIALAEELTTKPLGAALADEPLAVSPETQERLKEHFTEAEIVFLAGVTAAPVYHSHPHIPAEFDHIPEDAAAQTEMTMENLRQVLKAAGGELTDIVQLFRFIVDQDRNQNAINAVMGRYLGDHRPASTSVEIVRLATDPRLVLELAAVAVVPE